MSGSAGQRKRKRVTIASGEWRGETECMKYKPEVRSTKYLAGGMGGIAKARKESVQSEAN